MDDSIAFICRLAVVNRQGGVVEDFSWGLITVTSRNTNSTPPKEPFIIVRMRSFISCGTKYNLIGNIEHLSIEFLNEGRATVCLKEPSYNLIITKANPDTLTAFIVYLKEQLPKDSSVHISMAALEPPTCQIYLEGQEEYKLKMKNIIGLGTNLDQFTHLKITDCTLELAADQVPIEDAIRKMKNLTTLRLISIDLCSSTFLEIESKKLKQLHLSKCDTQLPIASLFKSDLCYKDSLVELCLEGNRWSEIPNGIFECQNLLRLSLRNNCLTELPDKFTNLSKLQELSLSRNQLTHVPSSIFSLQNLLKLSLSDNSITELPDMFTNLSKLQVLILSSNQISHLPPSIFALQNLSELNLNYNLISKLPDMFTNLPKLETLKLADNQLKYVPSSIFALENLSHLSLTKNHITELPDKFTNLSKLKYLSLNRNQLQYLPASICSLHLKDLGIANNAFNYDIFTPSVGSELIVHSLKELSYRTILNHKLKVEEGMLPKRFLKDLDNYRQCFCGCKFVEGQEFSFFCKLSDILSFNFSNCDSHLRFPIRGQLCTSFTTCFPSRFT